MSKYNTQTPYIASYLIVKDEQGRIALVLRENTAWLNGYYSLPAGKVEKGESFVQAAVREAKEEIGIDVLPEQLAYKITVHRTNEADSTMEWVDVFFEVTHYSGTVHNAEPDVHAEVAWFAPEDLPEKVTPPVREVIGAIGQGKTYLEHGWSEDESTI